MRCPHCAQPDYNLFGKNRGAQRYRCQACRQTFQTMQRQGYRPQRIGSKAIPQRTGAQSHWQNSRGASQNGLPWLIQAAGQLPVNQPRTKACYFIEVDELCSFVAKKIQMLDLRSDGFYCWQSAWLCLWQQVYQEARELFKQLKDLPTMGYGTDFLITYEHLIPKALHHQGKTFTTQIGSLNSRLRHYLARLHRRSLC